MNKAHGRLIKIFLSGIVAGTIDIGAACLISGRSLSLHAIAEGPARGAVYLGAPPTARLELLLHEVMSLTIAAAYVITAGALPLLKNHWIVMNLAYGAVVYFVGSFWSRDHDGVRSTVPWCMTLLNLAASMLGLACCASEAMASDHSAPTKVVPVRAHCGARTTSNAALEVLGSGGPMHGGGRASAAYLLWLNGRPQIVIDMGSGAAVALARARVSVEDIEILLVSHLHPDHVGDLPEFLWGALQADRKTPITIFGPSGAGDFPDIETFLTRLFAPDGAYPFMHVLLSDHGFHLETHVIAAAEIDAKLLLERNDLRITAYPVPHGRAPTLAYRIDGRDFKVVFAGDQSGLDPGFAQFARDADLLVLHAMLTEDAAGNPLAGVVALPSTLGKRASEANAKRVLLGHLMGADSDIRRIWSLSDRRGVLASVRAAGYHGQVLFAKDGECLRL